MPHAFDVSSSTYPTARRDDLVENLPAPDGPHAIADPYRWLEDASSVESKTWTDEQDALYDTIKASWGNADGVRERLGELLKAGFIGPPVWREDRCFFMRRVGDQEHAVLHVREGDTERVLIDPMELSAEGTTTLDAWQPSKEGNLVAYQVSEGGSEESVLYVLDVRTGDVVDGPIDRCRYSAIAWLPGGESFMYARRLAPDAVPDGEEQYHRRVMWHTLGQPADEDVELFGEGESIYNYYGVSVSLDGKWAVVTSSQGTDPRTDVRIASLESVTPQALSFQDVVVGEDARTSAHVDYKGRLWIETELGAPRGRVCVTKPENPSVESWWEVIAEREDAVFSDFAVVQNAAGEEELIASWTTHAVSEITRHSIDTGERTGEIALDGIGSVGGLVTRPGASTDMWFAYTDFVTNPRIMHFDATTAEVSVHANPPGAPDVSGITSSMIECTSADGTTVRAFVIQREDSLTDGAPAEPAPTVLYGYGGFGVSMTPGYSAGILAWVERGGRYVIACMRGGGEEGEAWHRDGMLGNKQNVFDDFYAVADHLTDGGYTTTAQLAISGGSNGGLLVGAAVTQRPEKWAAVVCSAPLLDMVRYQLHGLGATWAGEYGDAEKADELGWLKAYSPYHNTTPGTAYPAVLFEVFDGDSRVDPLHVRKMAAAMQHATTSDMAKRPIVVRNEREVGHGARALSRSLDLMAESTLFIAHHTGLVL